MNPRWERIAALFGIFAVALLVLGVVVIESAESPGENAAAAEYLSYYQDEENTILAGGVVFQLGALFFLWFLGTLRSRLLATEGGFGRLATTAYAGGLATAIFALAIPGPDMAGALSNEELTGDAALALNSLGDAFFIGAEFSAAVLVAATGLLAVTLRALPRWFGWASLVVALWLLIAPVGWAALIFAVPLWTIVASVLLYTRPTMSEPIPAAP